MSEGSKGGSFFSQLIPTPSIDIIKFWQGIVELSVRIALILFLLILFLVCAVAEGQAGQITDARYRAAKAAAGWSIFIGVIAIFYEAIFLITRFLIFPILQQHRTIYYIIEIVFKSVVALCLLTAFIALAVFAQQSYQLAEAIPEFTALLRSIGSALGGAAFFGFICLCICAFLAVWTALYLVFRWDLKSPSSSGGGVKA